MGDIANISRLLFEIYDAISCADILIILEKRNISVEYPGTFYKIHESLRKKYKGHPKIKKIFIGKIPIYYKENAKKKEIRQAIKRLCAYFQKKNLLKNRKTLAALSIIISFFEEKTAVYNINDIFCLSKNKRKKYGINRITVFDTAIDIAYSLGFCNIHFDNNTLYLLHPSVPLTDADSYRIFSLAKIESEKILKKRIFSRDII